MTILVPKFIRRYLALKELEQCAEHHAAVLMDPLNGCPGDFQEEFQLVQDDYMMRCFSYGASDEQVQRAMLKGQLRAREEWDKILGTNNMSNL